MSDRAVVPFIQRAFASVLTFTSFRFFVENARCDVCELVRGGHAHVARPSEVHVAVVLEGRHAELGEALALSKLGGRVRLQHRLAHPVDVALQLRLLFLRQRRLLRDGPPDRILYALLSIGQLDQQLVVVHIHHGVEGNLDHDACDKVQDAHARDAEEDHTGNPYPGAQMVNRRYVIPPVGVRHHLTQCQHSSADVAPVPLHNWILRRDLVTAEELNHCDGARVDHADEHHKAPEDNLQVHHEGPQENAEWPYKLQKTRHS
mmetsp:Transcript_54205/g.158259  ORF Transcript_54205/g.158259 Transcript_54205/m.158259 type:complete len:261 (+) Transcript_54205:1061-1843(+)